MSKHKNINLRLTGGLGNQLYQFSFAYYLYKKYGYKKIFIDMSGMQNYNEYWGVMLDLVFKEDFLKDTVVFKRSKTLGLRIPVILKKFNVSLHRFGFISDLLEVEESKSLNLKNNIFLDGYFENQSIRSEYKTLLGQYIKPDLNIDLPSNIVVINVRGGEYKRLGVSSLKNRQFYIDAVQQIKSKIEEPEFHLITDDVSFASELLDGVCEISKIHAPDPLSNFKHIYSAKYKILSLSTFAKWAAFLGNDSGESIYFSPF